jgi:hypothetical protein
MRDAKSHGQCAPKAEYAESRWLFRSNSAFFWIAGPKYRFEIDEFRFGVSSDGAVLLTLSSIDNC